LSVITGLLARSEAKKTRKAQEAANEKAETQAKEASALNEARADPGADIVFGAATGDEVSLRRKAKKAAPKASSGVFGGIGGLGTGSTGRFF